MKRQEARKSQRRSPSVAFGGSTRRPINRTYINRSDDRRYEVNRSNYNNYYYNPPAVVYRDWDRSRIHSWNNHRYHWRDNSWVVLDLPTVTTYTTGYTTQSLVTSVQAALENEGYDPGPIDGLLGNQTEEAIEDYQSDNGLYVTGEIDRPLLESLGLL